MIFFADEHQIKDEQRQAKMTVFVLLCSSLLRLSSKDVSLLDLIWCDFHFCMDIPLAKIAELAVEQLCNRVIRTAVEGASHIQYIHCVRSVLIRLEGFRESLSQVGQWDENQTDAVWHDGDTTRGVHHSKD